MRLKNINHTVLGVCLIATMAMPIAAQQCKPLVGSFEAELQPAATCPGPLCTAGHVWGGLHGTYRFTMDKIIPNGEPEVPTVSFFTGHSIITLKNGDLLFGTDTGAIDLPPGQGGFASLITFSGGTGAMAGATGQIRLRGEFDPVAGTTSGDYIGTVCKQR
ncbi:MAG: hypothetical protein JST28_08940 [Acidobacteria bacterium]|nr:hypothetical protein [Acidobacteriota bacterium]